MKQNDANVKMASDLAQKIRTEVRFTEKVTLKPFSSNPVWRNLRITNVTSEEIFKAALELNDQVAAFFVFKNDAACTKPVEFDVAWAAFKMAFPFDDTNYRSINA